MENYQSDVWIKNHDTSNDKLFSKAKVIEKLDNNKFKVKDLSSNDIKEIDSNDIQKANPIQFDGTDDMASLTYLNEPSVLNNLNIRYQNDKIYTHSGLFLVTVNPYKNLNIYNSNFIKQYSQNSIDPIHKLPPHIFGTAQNAFESLINDCKDQSILVTGESGAGKTENTKKVIQYILSVSTNSNNKDNALILENQILQANPILESFGNATTVRNLNSSRFGKFIKLKINTKNKELIGAHIDWYLLEKSRVILQDVKERNYHVFYQLLKGAPQDLLEQLFLSNTSVGSFKYLNGGITNPIDQINDSKDFDELMKAFETMNFSTNDTFNILKVLSIILNLGNISFKNQQSDSKQAVLTDDSERFIHHASHLLGVTSNDFKNSFLNSKIKVYNETVSQQRTASQAKFSIDALSKSLYEKLFQYLVDKINESFTISTNLTNDIFDGSNIENYIGILDIAGFEIFKKNSFEQLCINYTNEKLQQFFNHHMFELEQSEYMKEGISWNYIDFGSELKPTIELIEGMINNKRQPNIFSILNEECIVNGTDKSFIDKLFQQLETKDNKIDKNTLSFKANKLRDGFIIRHYAGTVDYSVDGWLNKNKDPLSSTMVELLSNSKDPFISNFFNLDILEQNISDSPIKGSPRKKSGMFRTVVQRHKEQLNLLMEQLSQTYPHFVRCILPNNEKKSDLFQDEIVLHQLRCNGVLEGIRIARSGYPNRIDFEEFARTYSILSSLKITKNTESKQVCESILENLNLNPDIFKLGLTKLFFRNGVLAQIQREKDRKLENLTTKLNSSIRGFLLRKDFDIKIHRLRASKVLVKNFSLYHDRSSDPWFKLVAALKPRLDNSSILEFQYTTKINKLENELKKLNERIFNETKGKDMVKAKLEALQNDVDDKVKLIHVKETEIGESKVKIVNLEKELTEMRELFSENTRILEQKDKQLKELSNENSRVAEGVKIEIEALKNTNTKLEGKVESDNKLVDIMKQEIAKLKSDNDQKDMEIASLKREKRSRDSESDNKLAELNARLGELLNENMAVKSELQLKTKMVDESSATIDDLKQKYKSANEELLKLQSIRKEFECKQIALDQADKLKKKYKQMKHELIQTRSLLDQKINDEVDFKEGRHHFMKELEETKTLMEGLQKELEIEKRNSADLELKLKHAALQTEYAIKDKKSLEIGNSRLKMRLFSNNPEQASLDQIEQNKLNSEIKPEIHELMHQIDILKARVARESYYNNIFKTKLKQNNITTDFLNDFRLNKISDESVSIYNDEDELVDQLKEKLNLEKEANKRLQDHNVQLQKDLVNYKSKYSRDSMDSNSLEILNNDSLEYKSKYHMAQIEIETLKDQLKTLRLKARKSATFFGDVPRNPLNDTTNIENSMIADPEHTKAKQENLRLRSELNELKTRLQRFESGNINRFEQEEEIIQLKNSLKSLQLKNKTLTSNIDVYKSRSEVYYTNLSRSEVELQTSLKECEKLKDDIQNYKAKIAKLSSQFEGSESECQELKTKLRELENILTDKELKVEQLNETVESLKEKLEDSEKLRKSVKSVNYEFQESENQRLNQELLKSTNIQTELNKMLKSLNSQLESSRKEINTAKFNNSELVRRENVLSKSLNECMTKNSALLSEIKFRISEAKNLSQQVSVLKATNFNLNKERDDLLSSKKLLEDKLQKISADFDQHLENVREDASHSIIAAQLKVELEKYRSDTTKLTKELQELGHKHDSVEKELEAAKNAYAEVVEENKQLSKLNNRLKEKLDDSIKKLKAEMEAQEKHWVERTENLEKELFVNSCNKRDESHQLNVLRRGIKDLEARNKDLERSKKHAEDEIKHLDEVLEKLQNNYASLSKREMEAQFQCKQLAKNCEQLREKIRAGTE